MKNVMLDLETFGNTSDSVIVAIGAVRFSKEGISDDSFYVNVDPNDCQDHGLTISASTVLWWLEQSEEARQAITKPKKISLKDALAGFSHWMKCMGDDDGPDRKERPRRRAEDPLLDRTGQRGTNYNSQTIKVWGNGSDFDNKLLSTAYEKIGWKHLIPWNFRNNRCYRTVKNLYPSVKMKRSGDHHNALDDAKSQANHLLELLKIGDITI
jgi:exodeoxyribonuclease VIII